jgi:DNA-binding Lrp family transcriptional regulator
MAETSEGCCEVLHQNNLEFNTDGKPSNWRNSKTTEYRNLKFYNYDMTIDRCNTSSGIMAMSKVLYLSEVDRKILKSLLTPDGKTSSKALARRIGIPPSTLQRRRTRLEKEFLKVVYTLDLERFGWHRVDFLIATESGKTDLIGKTLLKRDEVIYVGKSIGQHTIDLRVETILKDNGEILRMMELLKATSGIKEVMWTEIVQVLGIKTSVPPQIIDRL